MYGNCRGIGLITIFMGERDSLLEQSDEFDKKLNNEGITHNYIVGEEMFHV
jgi:hypothetical protein